jgi:hypothetical protein
LQLNIYRTILERKYGKKVTTLALVRLHPNAQSYQLSPVPILQDEMDALFAQRAKMIAQDMASRVAAEATKKRKEAAAVLALAAIEEAEETIKRRKQEEEDDA